LREQVTQDIRRRVAACFVALVDGLRIAGYYSLESASLLVANLPTSTGKKLPCYPTVPAVRMGHFAVDQTFKGQVLGGALLADALDRAARSEIAAFALMVPRTRRQQLSTGITAALPCQTRRLPCSCRWRQSRILETRLSKPFEPSTFFENSTAVHRRYAAPSSQHDFSQSIVFEKPTTSLGVL
jgi:GNAT superfamily N-acetyltransferase